MSLNSDRTSLIATIENEKKAENRTAPVYAITDGQLSLNDVLNPKPNNFDKQIDISWIDEALDKKAFETKYSAWDLIECPYIMPVCSCYGNGIGVVFGGAPYFIITKNHGNSWEEIPHNLSLNNAVITAVSYLEYIKETVMSDGEVVKTEIKKFVMVTDDGRCFITIDNFKTIEEITVPNDTYISLLFSSNKLFAFSTNGKIYISTDYAETFEEYAEYDIQFTSSAVDENGLIVAVGNAGGHRALCSFDNGITWQYIKVDNLNQYVSIVYGEGKFIACSIDGENRLLIFKYDFYKKDISAYQYKVFKDYQFIRLSYGSRVFVLISADGGILSSFDGERWIESPSALTGYIHILRTDKFFIAFSAYRNEDGFNAVRSSNGGLLGIHFATVQEIIDNEKSNLSIDIQGANGWFDWLENVRGITAQDVRLTTIFDTSIYKSFNDIIRPGEYFIFTNLEDKPSDTYIIGKLIVQKTINHLQEIYITQIFQSFITSDYFKYSRSFKIDTDVFPYWNKTYINQSEIRELDLSLKNITVSKYSTISAVQTFLAVDNNGRVCYIPDIDLSDSKIDISQDSTISAVQTFLAVDSNGRVCKIDNIDLSNNKIKVSETISYSSVQTFLIIDKNGMIKQTSIDDVKQSLSLKKLAYKDIVETDDIKAGAVTQEKLNNNGLPYLNLVTVEEFFKVCGYNEPVTVTIADIMKKLPNNSYYNLKGYVRTIGNYDYKISDLPFNPCVLSFRKIDSTFCLVTAYDHDTYGMFINTFRAGVVNGWKNIINSNGIINIDINSLANIIKTNPALIRLALGLGSLATKNSVNLSDLTQTTGILPSARGGFNYQDYLG